MLLSITSPHLNATAHPRGLAEHQLQEPEQHQLRATRQPSELRERQARQGQLA